MFFNFKITKEHSFKKSFLISLAILLIGGFLYQISELLPVYVVSLYAVYSFIEIKLLNRLFDSKLFLFLISFFTHTALFGVLVVIVGSIASFNLSSVLYLQLLITLLLLLYSYSVGRVPLSEARSLKLISGSDLIASATAIIFAASLLILPYYSSTVSTDAPGGALIYSVGSVDQASHTYMLNEYLELDTTQPWSGSSLGTYTRGFYPSSWHSANAMLLKVFLPNLMIGSGTMIALGILSIIWVSVLIFVFVKISFYIFKISLDGKKIGWSSYLVITLLSLLVTYWFSVHLLKFGFFSFTPQIIALFMFISCLIGDRKNGIVTSNLGLAAFYGCIVFVSWVLLLPALLLALGAMYFLAFKKGVKWTSSLALDLSRNLPLYFIAFIGSIAQLQLIRTVRPENTLSFMTGINVDGGAPIYDPILCIIITVTSALMYLKVLKNGNKSLLPLYLTAGSLILLISVIFILQTYTTGKLHYYYYKCLETALILLTPLFVGYVAFLVQKMKLDTLHKISLSLLVPLGLLILIPADTHMVSYMRGERSVSANILDSIATDAKNESKKQDVTIYLVGTNETSTIASLFTQSYKYSNECFDTLLNDDIVNEITQTAVLKLSTKKLPLECQGKNVVYKVGKTYKNLLSDHNGDKFDIEIIND